MNRWGFTKKQKMKTKPHCPQGTTTSRRRPYWLATLVVTALLAIASPAFAKTDQTASPPAIKSTADQIVLDTSAPPPDIVQQIALIASPQKNDGYANQSAATQQAGGFGMNLGATSWSPPANVTFTGTIADTSPGIFALIS